MSDRSIIDVFTATAKQRGNAPALGFKRDGRWQTLSWRDYHEQVMTTAQAFISLGLQPGEGVAILGYNRPEWVIADLAAIAAGGCPAGIYTTSSPEQCRYVIDHGEASIVVVENSEYLDKILAVREQLPGVKAIVVMEDAVKGDSIWHWEQLGELAGRSPTNELQQRIDNQRPEHACTLIYTSGTTGNPKAVMLTHHNLVWSAENTTRIIGIRPEDQTISYLPLSHIAEQVLTIHGPITTGSCVYFSEGLEQLGENLREVRPHVFMGVPRVWEKIQAQMQAAGAEAPALRRKIAAWARGVGARVEQAYDQGYQPPLAYGLAKKLVFDKVRKRLGLDRSRLEITASAPLARDTMEFFANLGIRLHEVYGLSETTGATTLSYPGNFRRGSVGRGFEGVELRIAEDGEICIRGPHIFKGYYKNEEATREAIDEEGWFKSGDIGRLDEDGFLYITDRKKEIIITAGGENIAPHHIEGELKAIPVVAQAVVIGDSRKYLGALLTLDPEKIASEAQAIDSPAREAEIASECPKFMAHLQQQIDAVNDKLARVETIKRWRIIPHEFTVDGGELTPTMKLKRRVIQEKYSAEIESLYSEEEAG